MQGASQSGAVKAPAEPVRPGSTVIGFVGLGIMGKPMAANLLKAGYALRVYDINPAPIRELVGKGAVAAGSAAEAAEGAHVVITMVPDSPDVQAAVFGPKGVAESLRSGMVYIDMSTISPIVTREISGRLAADKGVPMLDAPVSGGETGAIQATLSIMVGGPEEVFTACKPIFEVLGKNIVYMGDTGAGQVTKACNQIVVAVTIQAVSEALILARRAGVDPARVRQALLGGFAQSRIMELHGQRILDGNFKPGFKVRLHHKDLNIALSTGRALNVPLLTTGVVNELLASLRARGKGEWDHSALAALLEEMSGGKVDEMAPS